MRTQFYCVKGIVHVQQLTLISGIDSVHVNPLGAGPNIIEVEHQRNPNLLPAVVKDQTIGLVILEPENGRSKNPVRANEHILRVTFKGEPPAYVYKNERGCWDLTPNSHQATRLTNKDDELDEVANCFYHQAKVEVLPA